MLRRSWNTFAPTQRSQGDWTIESRLPESFLNQPAIAAIRAATVGSPFEGKVWVVGGVVRDLLLGGGSAKDIDLAVLGDAQALAHSLHQQGVSSIFPVVFERFGTAQVVVEGEPVELVSTRREQYEPRSRKPVVEFGTIREDALRRDFTLNALYGSIHTGEILDPTEQGLADLRAGILRTPLEPRRTFSEDPLRMLRAVRFWARFGFRFAPGLREGIVAVADRLQVISAERIREEFVKMLEAEKPSRAIEELSSLGLLPQFLPELETLRGVTQGSFHHLDVWGHSLLALDNIASQNILLRVAGLLHDIGKPATRSVDDDGRIRFFTHEHVGADMAGEILGRLKFSNDEIAYVKQLVRHHMRFGHSQITSSAARRTLRALGESVADLLTLCEADASAHHPDVPHLDVAAIRAKIHEVRSKTPAEKLESPLDGHAILRRAPHLAGKEIGAAKAHLLELVLSGDLAPDDIGAAEAHFAAWLGEHGLQ